jgi:VCBS repeat-containing protein
MTTISNSTTIGITLTSPTDVNPIVVNPGITVANTGIGYGIYASGGFWTIQNDGKISSADRDGVFLISGGSVTNAASASITGYGDGVACDGVAGTVVNSGKIAGAVDWGVGLFAGGLVTNAASASITGGFAGVVMFGAGTVLNSGSVAGVGTTGVGVSLNAGGSVTNAASAAITGAGSGVGIFHSAGTVMNSGSITGSSATGIGVYLGAGGAVTNAVSALVSGGDTGIAINSAGIALNSGVIAAKYSFGVRLMSGGSATNAASGSITAGEFGIDVQHAAGMVLNSGRVAATDIGFGYGIELEAGGSVINASFGSVTGLVGVAIYSAGTVANAGSIMGSGTAGIGVDLGGGGSVTNAASASVAGGPMGVEITGSAGTVVNSGSITATGTAGLAVCLSGGGSVTNAVSGSISGSAAGVELLSGGTVTNAGTIKGGSGTAVSFAGTASNRLVVDPGAVFDGKVIGSTSASNIMELASAGSIGTLSGLGTSFASFGTVMVDSGASWTLTSGNTIAAGATLVNSGTVMLSGGTLTDSGSLVNNGAIVLAPGTLTVANMSGNGTVTISSDGVLDVLSGIARNVTVSSGGTLTVSSGATASGPTVDSGGTVEVLGGGTLAGNVVDDGTVDFDITGSAIFSGSLTGSGTLLVSGGGALDMASAYTGSAQIDDTSTLEFTGAYVGAATFSGSATGPGGTLKLDAGSVGPITVVNPNDSVIAQAGNGSWIQALVNYTLPTHIDTLLEYGAQGTGNTDAVGDALYALNPAITQTLIGNTTNDAFVVYSTSDVVVAKAGSHDLVYAAANYTLPTGVDVLIMEAGTTGTGNTDATGDALYAASTTQTMTLVGNTANDTFVVYDSSDVLVPKAGSHDVVYSAVNYALPAGVDVLILEAGTQAVGNSDASGDALYAANPGIAQTLIGHSHNDTFVVYNAADTVVGQADSTDTVYTAVNFTLPINVDALLLEGTASEGTGNGDAVDALFGNPNVASTLVAGSGADVLTVVGTAGTVLTGGAGPDTFVFPNGMGHDVVTNFNTAKDALEFSPSLFASFSAAMATASQVGANTVLTIDANDAVTLDNVSRSTLSASNFPLLDNTHPIAITSPPVSETITAPVNPASGAVFTVTATLTFSDLDPNATTTAIATPVGSFYLGTFVPVVTTQAIGGSPGTVTATFQIPDSYLALLSAGQTATQVYDVTLSDGQGLPTTQTATITMVGSNDAPVVSAGGDVAGSITADPLSPPSSYSQAGTFDFTDVNLGDKHTVSVTPNGAGYLGTLTAAVAVDSTGGNTGEVTWNYQVGDAAMAALAEGQSVTQTYTVTINDGQGGTATQLVTVTLTGGDHAPAIAIGPTDSAQAAISFVGATGATQAAPPPPPQQATGTLSFSDVDVGDTHSVSVSPANGALGTLTAVVTRDTTGGSAGIITWTYQLDPTKAAALVDGATQADTFTVTVNDGYGGTAQQTVTVNVTGGPHAPQLVVAASDNDQGSASQQSSESTGTLTIADVDPDTTFTDANISVAPVGTVLGTMFAGISSGNQIGWIYNVDATAAAQLSANHADVFAVTVTDSQGATATHDITIEVTGSSSGATAITNIFLNRNAWSSTAPGTIIGVLSATDTRSGTPITYSLTDDAGGQLALNGNELVVGPNGLTDPQSADPYRVEVEASDGFGATLDRAFSLSAPAASAPPLDFSDDVSVFGGSHGLSWDLPLINTGEQSIPVSLGIPFGPISVDGGVTVDYSLYAALNATLNVGGDVGIDYQIDPQYQDTVSGDQLTIDTANFSVGATSLVPAPFSVGDTSLDVGLNIGGSAGLGAELGIDVLGIYNQTLFSQQFFSGAYPDDFDLNNPQATSQNISLLDLDASDLNSDDDSIDLGDYVTLTAALPTDFSIDSSYTPPAPTYTDFNGVELPSVSAELESNPFLEGSIDLTELATSEFPPLGYLFHGEGSLFSYDFPGLTITDLLGPFGQIIDGFIDALGDVYDAAGNLIGQVGDAAGDIWSTAGNFIGNEYNQLQTAFNDATGAIGLTVQVGKDLYSVASNFAQAIWNQASTGWNIPSYLSDLLPSNLPQLPSFIPFIQGVVGWLDPSSLNSLIQQGLSGLGGIIGGILGAIGLSTPVETIPPEQSSAVGGPVAGATSGPITSGAGSSIANWLGTVLSPQNLNLSYSYSTIDASIDATLQVVQQITFVPTSIEVTMTPSSGAEQMGPLGSSFTFTLPVSASEPFSIETSYVLKGTLTSEFGIKSTIALDTTELQLIVAGIKLLPGNTQENLPITNTIWLPGSTTTSDVELSLPPGSTPLQTFTVPVSDGSGGTENRTITVTNVIRATVMSILPSGADIDTRGNGDLNAGHVVTFTVNFDEPVTVDLSGGRPSLVLNNGGAAVYAGGSGTSALTFDYIVLTGQDTPDVSVSSLLNGETIADASGVEADVSGATGYDFVGTLQIDTTPPDVTVALANDTSHGSRVTSDPTLTGTGDPNTIVHFTIDGSPISATVTADASGNWTYLPTLSQGAHEVDVSETDPAGNTGTTSIQFTLDTVPPDVTSIVADTSLSNADTLYYTVTFSKTVSGVNASQFSLFTKGLVGASVAGVSPVSGSDGTQYFVEVAAGTGAGTLALDVSGSNIQDVAGNYLDTSFAAPVLYADEPDSGEGFDPVVTADLTGDGIQDAVTVGYDGQLEVLLGNGDGTFKTPTSYPVEFPDSVAIGDLTHSGHPDIVVGSSYLNQISVLLGNGDGTFQAPSVVQATVVYGIPEAHVTSLAVADLNGDGLGDIVYGNWYYGVVGVLIGNGDGTFKPEVDYPVDPNLMPQAVAVASLRDNGIEDIVTANDDSTPGPFGRSTDYLAGSVSVLLGNGDGTFQNEVSYALPGASHPDAVTIADLNGDGIPDIIVADYGLASVGGDYGTTPARDYGVSILFGNGDGTFKAPVTYLTGPNPMSVAVADVNGDGLPDIITGNPEGEGGSISILLNQGNGTFAAPITFSAPSASLAVANLNGAGPPDIVDSADFALFVLQNQAAVGPLFAIGVLALAHDTGASASDGITSNDTVTAEAGFFHPDATINFTIDGNPIAATVTSDAKGEWSFTPTGLVDGPHTIVASETVPPSNTVAGTTIVSELSFTLDTTAPVVAIASAGGSTTQSVAQIFGTVDAADAGSTVTVLEDGATAGTATVQPSGGWSASITLNGTGQHTLVAHDTDVAGNVGTSNSVTFTLNPAPPQYAYQTIVDPAANPQPFTSGANQSDVTSVQGINGAGAVVGTYFANGTRHAFLLGGNLTITGTNYTTIDDPAATNGNAQGINDSGQIVGNYNDSGGDSHGFLLTGTTYQLLNDPQSASSTWADGINDAGEVVGSYLDASGLSHGFLYGGGYTPINDPQGTGGTSANGINAAGEIVGNYVDSLGASHGFTYSNGTYTTLDDPLGVGGTFANGVNDAGEVVGSYLDGNGISHGFLYSGGTYTTLDDPLGADGTTADGINDVGAIVGSYDYNNAGVSVGDQGFLAYAGIDLTNIVSGQNATLAYAPNSGHTGGTLTVSDGVHASTITLLGQYAAADFKASSDYHGGTVITDPTLSGAALSQFLAATHT